MFEYLKSKGLLDMINEPDSDSGDTPLHDALYLIKEEAAGWLIDNAADVNAIRDCFRTTTFMLACKTMSFSFVEELAGKVAPDHLALPNNYDKSPMLCAFMRNADLGGNLPIARLLILRGVPGHVRSDNGPEFIAKVVREWRQSK